MAAFEILEKQGLRVVRVTLANETVRAESGAMAYMRGAITMHAKLPSVGKWLKATLSGEAPVRPRYTGTGELLSWESGSTAVPRLRGGGGSRPSILENGAYWASEGKVKLGLLPRADS